MYRYQYRKILKYLLKGFAVFCLGFLVISAVTVTIFRWAPVTTSGVMIQRKIEAYFDGSSATESRMVWTRWEDIAPSAPLAVIAAEDQLFYEHSGFDFKQLKQALEASKQGKRLRGASTISQQTAKNLFLWGGRSYTRKGLEVWFTLLIETLWPKERILEVYLNIVEFGPDIYGVEAASQTFFDKPSNGLHRHESALLAAVLPNPHRMHVGRPSSYVRKRQIWIVEQMAQLGSVKLLRTLSADAP